MTDQVPSISFGLGAQAPSSAGSAQDIRKQLALVNPGGELPGGEGWERVNGTGSIGSDVLYAVSGDFSLRVGGSFVLTEFRQRKALSTLDIEAVFSGDAVVEIAYWITVVHKHLYTWANTGVRIKCLDAQANVLTQTEVLVADASETTEWHAHQFTLHPSARYIDVVLSCDWYVDVYFDDLSLSIYSPRFSAVGVADVPAWWSVLSPRIASEGAGAPVALPLALVNGDAETGDLTGWTVLSGTGASISTDAASGAYSFLLDTGVGQTVTIAQTVALTGQARNAAWTGTCVAALSFAVKSGHGSDVPSVRISYFDAFDAFVSDEQHSVGTTQWGTMTVQMAIPFEASSIRVELVSPGYGSPARFDDVSLALCYPRVTPGVMKFLQRAPHGAGMLNDEVVLVWDTTGWTKGGLQIVGLSLQQISAEDLAAASGMAAGLFATYADFDGVTANALRIDVVHEETREYYQDIYLSPAELAAIEAGGGGALLILEFLGMGSGTVTIDFLTADGMPIGEEFGGHITLHFQGNDSWTPLAMTPVIPLPTAILRLTLGGGTEDDFDITWVWPSGAGGVWLEDAHIWIPSLSLLADGSYLWPEGGGWPDGWEEAGTWPDGTLLPEWPEGSPTPIGDGFDWPTSEFFAMFAGGRLTIAYNDARGWVASDGPYGAPAILGSHSVGQVASAPALLNARALAVHDFSNVLGLQVNRYVMDISGEPTLRLPISSWQATLQTGAKQYLQAVIPAAASVVAEVSARRQAGATFMVSRVATLNDGARFEYAMSQAPLTDVRFDAGARRASMTISGYSDAPIVDDFAGFSRVLSGVRTISTYASGQRVRCDVDWILRPGHTAIYSGGSFVVGWINYYVQDADQYMDVGSTPTA